MPHIGPHSCDRDHGHRSRRGECSRNVTLLPYLMLTPLARGKTVPFGLGRCVAGALRDGSRGLIHGSADRPCASECARICRGGSDRHVLCADERDRLFSGSSPSGSAESCSEGRAESRAEGTGCARPPKKRRPRRDSRPTVACNLFIRLGPSSARKGRRRTPSRFALPARKGGWRMAARSCRR